MAIDLVKITKFIRDFGQNEQVQSKKDADFLEALLDSRGASKNKVTNLTNLLFDFFAYEELKQKNILNVQGLSSLRTRGLNGVWNSRFKKLQKSITNYEIDSDKRYKSLLFEIEKFHNVSLDPLKMSQQNYEEVLDALDYFYLINTLEIGIQALALNKFNFPVELEDRFESLLEYSLNSNLGNKSVYLDILEKSISLLKGKEEDLKPAVLELLQLLNDLKQELPIAQFIQIRSIVRNYIIHLVNRGESDLQTFVFELYKEDVEEGYIYHQGKVSALVVNNIAIAAIRAGSDKWLEDFLSSSSLKILEKYIERFTIALNRSKLLFFQKKFDEVLETLDFEVNEPRLKARARVLEVMTHFELKTPQLDHKIEAFKIFSYRLTGFKLSEKFIKAHNGFIDILKSIHHPKTAHDERRCNKIKDKILAMDVLVEKDWLLEKVNALLVKK